MMFHGPSDKESKHTEQLMRWRIKLKTNDEQRQQFLKQYMPKIYQLGLTVPDEWEMQFDEESGEWTYREPDWEEFLNVVRGNGPASALRLRTRKMAHEDGAWVREALTAASERTSAETVAAANYSEFNQSVATAPSPSRDREGADSAFSEPRP
jgi:ring-1,2-phenylacetyl-CoA epoxidase subunit PaaA